MQCDKCDFEGSDSIRYLCDTCGKMHDHVYEKMVHRVGWLVFHVQSPKFRRKCTDAS